MPIVIAALILLIVVILIRNIRIVQQAKAYVIERLGAYKETWNVGMHLKVPFIERVAKVVTLKEQVADFPPQPVITKDNVTMQIDTVVYFQITDPKLFTYGIEQPMVAIENLSATRMADLFSPSAFRMDSRRSRSAFICFSIAFWISLGGRMFFSSTRLTLMPQGSVASSRMERILVLMMSRLVRHWSNSRSPMMLRSVVAARFSMATMGCSMP